MSTMVTATGREQRRNVEFCLTIGLVTRTADRLAMRTRRKWTDAAAKIGEKSFRTARDKLSSVAHKYGSFTR